MNAIFVLTYATDYEGETVSGVTTELQVANEWLLAPLDSILADHQHLYHRFNLAGNEWVEEEGSFHGPHREDLRKQSTAREQAVARERFVTLDYL